jgi:hypothetical protein
MKSKTEISEAQGILIDFLKSLKIEKDNIIVIMLMLKSYSQQVTMLEWLHQNWEKNPTQEQIMNIAQKIMHEVK